MNTDFVFDDKLGFGPEERAAFDNNGYVVLRRLLSKEEVDKLRVALEHSNGVMSKSALPPNDKKQRLNTVGWRQPGNDVTGIVARSEKMVHTAETLLGGEVYHYCARAMSKMPKTGGSPHWHQDYGYWYHCGLLFPSVGTLWIAIDKSTKENGCTQFLSGSHKMGRIDLQQVESKEGSPQGVKNQTVADPGRVKLAKKHFKQIHVEAEPGDAIFFHCNTLHRSDPNESLSRRMAYLIMYGRVDNGVPSEHGLPNQTPIDKVPNEAILDCANISNLEGKHFMELDKGHNPPSIYKASHRDVAANKVVEDEQKLLRSHWIEY